MATWSFRCYGTKKPNSWQKWFDVQSVTVKAKHDQVFDILEQRPQAQWTPPYAKKLKGGTVPLWEILITKGVAWRVFGWFSGEWEFTVTGIGYHKDQAYDPRHIIETSRRRRTEIDASKLEVTSCARPETP